MIAISSQDFRNAYEKFYNEFRKYLWPYEVLEVLADIEVNIYSSFIDMDKLRIDFAKLRKSMKDVINDDEFLAKFTNKIQKLLDDKDAGSYLRLPRVNEVNPENDKVIKTFPDDEED